VEVRMSLYECRDISINYYVVKSILPIMYAGDAEEATIS